jgi:hypothetical protein
VRLEEKETPAPVILMPINHAHQANLPPPAVSVRLYRRGILQILPRGMQEIFQAADASKENPFARRELK